MKAILSHILLALVAMAALSACIEDGFTTSPSDRPAFSTDTLDLGVIFTDEPSVTNRFMVYNPHSKSLSISDIEISGPDASCFRMNVDGLSGSRFSNVEIRAKDSIYVFVEATLPSDASVEPIEFEAAMNFTTNGVTESVVLAARGQNVHRLRGLTIDADETFTADIPYQIFDSLVVAPGATLTIEPGATLCFHDKAMMVVRGTLRSEGTAEQPVVMAGDRTGNVVGDISFDIMSRQWVGLFFTASSTANVLSHTIVKNTDQGVAIYGDPEADYSAAPQLTLLNSRLRNSGDLAFEAVGSAVRAIGCEFAEAGGGLVNLAGGSAVFNHCTFSNHYLFSAIAGPAISFSHYIPEEPHPDLEGYPILTADFSNSIIYGLGADLSEGDFTGTAVTFRSCLFKSEGSDDDNFIASIWGEDPLFYTVRDEYIFDYRLRPESPAAAAADPTLTLSEAATDPLGTPRLPEPSMGAYQFLPQPEE